MKILVTGGTGFCGSHIAKNLYDLGHDVCVTGTQTEHDLNLRILNHHSDRNQLEFIKKHRCCLSSSCEQRHLV